MDVVPEGSPPLLTCLVPVRNGESDLPGFLDSVAGCCDAVVALDDGSTDATLQRLAASPLVRVLITNPRRETFAGWDDAGNRSRLLAAAAALRPRWMLWLDADERLDPSDASALRRFVAEEARPDRAYGFRIFPMRRDQRHFENRCLWVYRLFHHAPGQTLEGRRLHLFPIPSQIPSERWQRTTLRLQHLGGLTAERRRQRYEKYREADPHCEFQSDYSALLREPPPALPLWQPRDPAAPVLWTEPGAEPQTPVTVVSGSAPALSCLLIQGVDSPDAAPSAKTVQAAEPWALESDDVELVPVEHAWLFGPPDRPTLDGRALNAALARARGAVVCLVLPGWQYSHGSVRAMVEVHRRGFAMVAATPSVGTQAERGAVLGRPPGFCSWSRSVLMEMGGFPERLLLPCQTFNATLMAAGWQAFAAPGVHLLAEVPPSSGSPVVPPGAT